MIPSATYRLQFRDGMTFDRAIALIGHLQALGVSHLYASPVFKAVTGSTHGYDIVDANAIDPALGGRAGFDRLSDALLAAGLKLILDIVPNHMAASVENGWWRDVLRHGQASPYADHFDIDWREKLTLPVLGQPLEAVLAAGELKLERKTESDRLELAYFDNAFPLSDDSIAGFAGNDAASTATLDTAQMRHLLDRQHWQLIHWKEAASHLSYRRFFEVTGLVGLRVEDDTVFDDSHRLILELVRSGRVQGLRVDHVDGLAEPSGYLDRLRKAVGPDVYLTVEKILGPGETLPAHWPVSGTTGYEFIAALSHLFVARDGLADLQAAYERIDPDAADYEAGLRRAKRQMVERNFEGEVNRLVALAQSAANDIDPSGLRDALRELLIAFPVYRTYGYRDALDDADKAVLASAVSAARRHLHDGKALNAIEGLMLDGQTSAQAFEFRARFQQLSGPIMAKALEDTLFYRSNRLIAANEVGGEPNAEPGGTAAFHQAMLERVYRQPHGLSTTATHDTKRGEDARARLYTLSEGAGQWLDGIERWRAINRPQHINGEGAAPEPNVEWMLYQSLAGLWPANLDTADLGDLRTRFVAYAEKAIREAKQRTDWNDQNADYETAVKDFAGRLLSPDNSAFLADFEATLRPFRQAGFINSLSQTLIKLTAPGVPDVYQGTEGLDFSLIDPDNRRPIDTAGNAEALGAEGPTSPTRRKAQLIGKVFGFRKANKALFDLGTYQPLEVSGRRKDHVVAFARVLDGHRAVTIAPRLMFGVVDPETGRIPVDFWDDTTVHLPASLAPPMRDVVSGATISSPMLELSTLLTDEDVALLV